MLERGEDGEPLWLLEAESADAIVGEDGSYGDLKGVVLTLYQDGRESITITSETGWVHQAAARFILEGDVLAKSADGRFSLTCGRISGSPESGLLDASEQVVATADGMTLGPAGRARARFETPGENEMNTATAAAFILTSLVMQGGEAWTITRDNGNLVISGVTESNTLFEKGRPTTITLEGAPVQAVWKREGLQLTGRSLVATFLNPEPEGPRSERLEEATVKGGVTVVLAGRAGAEGVESVGWTLNVQGSQASFSRKEALIKIIGGVTATSDHPIFGGALKASSVEVRLDRAVLDREGRFEPVSMAAIGPGIEYEYSDETTTLRASRLDRLEVSLGESPETRLLAGEGSPFLLEFASSTGAESLIVEGLQFTGTLGREVVDELETWRLLSGRFWGGVEVTVTGASDEEEPDAEARTWTINIKCPEIRYDRRASTMELLGGVTITGDHEIIGRGGGTAYGPRAVITFRPDSFEPAGVWMGGGGD